MHTFRARELLTMHNLSMMQALSIWGELVEARLGENGFGGHTAEIYIYRLMPYVSAWPKGSSLEEEHKVDACRQANRSLIALIERFEAEHESFSVKIVLARRDDGSHDEEPAAAWITQILVDPKAYLDHRVHLKVCKRA